MDSPFSASLNDKIFEIKSESGNISKVISYFPFSEKERMEIKKILGDDFDSFGSIFTDVVSDEEWEKTKVQIKKKFNDELFHID
jgi:hypothetical protein